MNISKIQYRLVLFAFSLFFARIFTERIFKISRPFATIRERASIFCTYKAKKQKVVSDNVIKCNEMSVMLIY